MLVPIYDIRKANDLVSAELRSMGAYTPVTLTIAPIAPAQGYYIDCLGIVIPWVSLNRTVRTIPVASVLRHEYGHAWAWKNDKLVNSRTFSKAFGDIHDGDTIWEYDPECFVTQYAATSPCEDWAETFMMFIEHRGKLPRKWRGTLIQDKWNCVNKLLNKRG